MQRIELDGARPSPGASASRIPQQYAQPSMPAGFAPSGANASRFDEDTGACATEAVVADAPSSIVADAIVAQAVIAHSIVADSLAGDAEDSAQPTHWSRILYYDFMDGNMRAVSSVETGCSKPEPIRSLRNRSPLMQGAVLLAIYIAMYLVVAFVIHVLPTLDGPGRQSVGPNWALDETSLCS